MASRAVAIVCRDEDAARRRFGVVGEGVGICYTRTGRRFFDDPSTEKEFLQKVCGAVGAAGFWEQFQTDWICLDAELMPWSAKAPRIVATTMKSLALRQFAPGIEALERFVRQEPLGRVHECVFGVLALESEPVDPRL